MMTPEEQARALLKPLHMDCLPKVVTAVAAALADKDERIAQLERSNEFITRCFDEREKALADAYTEREQLKERVRELEQQMRVFRKPPCYR